MALTGNQAYALSKKYTNDSISGISGTVAGKNCTVDSIVKSGKTSTVTFKWTADDGTSKTDTMTVNDGLDGKEIASATINASNHLILTMSDASTVDCGVLPSTKVAVSKESGNGLTEKTDGLYVSTTGVEISKATDNAIETKTDGLYVKKTSDVEISKATGNIIEQKADGMYAPSTDISGKVDKVTGKGLSTNDYDDTEKAQVAKIAGKIDRAQGTVNAGKILVVGSNGNVTLDRRDVVSAWETTPVDTNVPSEKLVKDNLDEINADLTAQVELGYLRNKNLVDGVLNAVIDSSGNITRGSGDKTTVIFYALANTKYTVSGSNRDRSRVVRCTEKPKIGSTGTIVIDNDSTTTFIASVGGWYAWYMSSTSDSAPQVEKGSVATSYVEPNGKSNAELTKLVNDDLKMLGWTVPSECPIQNYTDANGIFHQRVGRVDLGSLAWGYLTSPAPYFGTDLSNIKINTNNMYCKAYPITKSNVGIANMPDKTLKSDGGSYAKVYVKDSSYTDATTFKSAMSGVYLYYELTTEVTKSVDGNEALENKLSLSGGAIKGNTSINNLEIGATTSAIDIDKIHNSSGYLFKLFNGSFSGTSPASVIGGNSFMLLGFSAVNSTTQKPMYGSQIAFGFGSTNIAIRSANYNASGGSWSDWKAISST